MSRQYIEFYLGQSLIRIDDPSPKQTLYRFLRDQPARKGTKEGCAEGDCGACMVLLGELVAGAMTYKAVNSCILFLATLDGKQVLTVEDLATGDDLHPAQQAMADFHGSQCGYCTPGIVISLAALNEANPKPDRSEIDDTLSGNLCRCTGYGPIIDAARKMSGYPDGRNLAQGVDATLLGRDVDDGVAISDALEQVFSPRTSDDLAEIYEAHPNATILAGGTDVGLWVTKQHRNLGAVIYLGNVVDLKQIETKSDVIEIPAGVTIEQARPILETEYPGLCSLLRRFASKPIRNSATVCGNIANGSPIGDLPPPLIALGARVVLRKGATRRDILLEDFFVGYGKQDRLAGEFVEKLILPRLKPGQILSALKISKRFDQDISAVCAAVFVVQKSGSDTDIRVAFGGMAATPMRARLVESHLNSGGVTEAAIDRAVQFLSQDFSPISDMRASAAYRMEAAQNALKRMLTEIVFGQDLPTVWDVEATQ